MIQRRRSAGLGGRPKIVLRSGGGPQALDASVRRALGDVPVRSVFADETMPLVLAALSRGAGLERPVDFASFRQVELAPEAIAPAMRRLRHVGGIHEIYVHQTGPDPLVSAVGNPAFDRGYLGYLDPAPVGIDAPRAWQLGCDGRGQRFVDVERGWTTDHQDLIERGIGPPFVGTIRGASRSHGTSVLGIVCAADNRVGGIGIAPAIDDAALAAFDDETSLEHAIAAAVVHLAAGGGVLLIEAQVLLPSGDPSRPLLGPVEAYPVLYALIELADALGILVVQVAGNGTAQLRPDGSMRDGCLPALAMDDYTFRGCRIFDPTVRDSGAIIVTAASAETPHTRLPYAAHGRRITCYAWGEQVFAPISTPEGATTAYTRDFRGSSAAAAIVAGAALVARSACSGRLPPRRLRELLIAGGTPAAPSETTRIGVMPNLDHVARAASSG